MVATTERRIAYLQALLAAGATDYYLKPIIDIWSSRSSGSSHATSSETDLSGSKSSRRNSLDGSGSERPATLLTRSTHHPRSRTNSTATSTSGSGGTSTAHSHCDEHLFESYADMDLRITAILGHAHLIISQHRTDSLIRVC